MKGCVRGYGNYEELTSSGVDPTELFDDIEEDTMKSPNLMQPDVVIEESVDVEEEETDTLDIKSPDHIHLLSIEKARRRVKSKHSGSYQGASFNPNFDGLLEEVSLFTGPSLLSLVSTHDNIDSIRGTKKVTILCVVLKPLCDKILY